MSCQRLLALRATKTQVKKRCKTKKLASVEPAQASGLAWPKGRIDTPDLITCSALLAFHNKLPVYLLDENEVFLFLLLCFALSCGLFAALVT